MHCSDEESDHATEFFPSPTLKEVGSKRQNYVPACKKCGKPMKPHCMFFDENYSERFYRKDTVEKFLEWADCLIVVGTALQTNFAARIVNTVKARAPVIEVNIESSIKDGYLLRLLGKSEVTLPALFDAYHKLVDQKASPIDEANNPSLIPTKTDQQPKL